MSEQPEGHRLLDDNDALMFEAATEALQGQKERLAQFDGVPGENWWEAEAALMSPIFAPAILEVMITGAEFSLSALEQAGVAVAELNIGDVLTQLEIFAQQEGNALISQLNNTSRSKLAEIFNELINSGFSQEQAAAAIESVYGPVRASMIAVTESTAAYSRGVEALRIALAGQGVQTDAYWLTVNDNLVCQICEPLHGTQRNVGYTKPPPAHVGCRCGEVAVPAGEVITDPLFEFEGEV